MKNFDLDKICKFKPLSNLDAGENIFFKKELEHLMPEMYTVDYAVAPARSLFPVDRSAGPVAETITYRQFDMVGMAKIIADYDTELPLVNVHGKEFTGRVVSLGDAAKWSLQEIRAALALNKPLESWYAIAARDAILREENRIAFFGDAVHQLVGLLSDSNIPQAAVPVGGGGFTEWSTKTPAEILADMNLIANQITEVTYQIETPDAILLPVEQYNLIATTPAGNSTDTTILKYFLGNNPYIKEVLPVNDLDEAVGGDDVIVAYKKDPMKLRLQIPLDIEQLPPQEVALATIVSYHSRFGGLTVLKPLSINIGTGI
jgi:hypothetical protein